MANDNKIKIDAEVSVKNSGDSAINGMVESVDSLLSKLDQVEKKLARMSKDTERLGALSPQRQKKQESLFREKTELTAQLSANYPAEYQKRLAETWSNGKDTTSKATSNITKAVGIRQKKIVNEDTKKLDTLMSQNRAKINQIAKEQGEKAAEQLSAMIQQSQEKQEQEYTEKYQEAYANTLYKSRIKEAQKRGIKPRGKNNTYWASQLNKINLSDTQMSKIDEEAQVVANAFKGKRESPALDEIKKMAQSYITEDIGDTDILSVLEKAFGNGAKDAFNILKQSKEKVKQAILPLEEESKKLETESEKLQRKLRAQEKMKPVSTVKVMHDAKVESEYLNRSKNKELTKEQKIALKSQLAQDIAYQQKHGKEKKWGAAVTDKEAVLGTKNFLAFIGDDGNIVSGTRNTDEGVVANKSLIVKTPDDRLKVTGVAKKIIEDSMGYSKSNYNGASITELSNVVKILDDYSTQKLEAGEKIPVTVQRLYENIINVIEEAYSNTADTVLKDRLVSTLSSTGYANAWDKDMGLNKSYVRQGPLFDALRQSLSTSIDRKNISMGDGDQWGDRDNKLNDVSKPSYDSKSISSDENSKLNKIVSELETKVPQLRAIVDWIQGGQYNNPDTGESQDIGSMVKLYGADVAKEIVELALSSLYSEIEAKSGTRTRNQVESLLNPELVKTLGDVSREVYSSSEDVYAQGKVSSSLDDVFQDGRRRGDFLSSPDDDTIDSQAEVVSDVKQQVDDVVTFLNVFKGIAQRSKPEEARENIQKFATFVSEFISNNRSLMPEDAKKMKDFFAKIIGFVETIPDTGKGFITNFNNKIKNQELIDNTFGDNRTTISSHSPDFFNSLGQATQKFYGTIEANKSLEKADDNQSPVEETIQKVVDGLDRTIKKNQVLADEQDEIFSEIRRIATGAADALEKAGVKAEDVAYLDTLGVGKTEGDSLGKIYNSIANLLNFPEQVQMSISRYVGRVNEKAGSEVLNYNTEFANWQKQNPELANKYKVGLAAKTRFDGQDNIDSAVQAFFDSNDELIQWIAKMYNGLNYDLISYKTSLDKDGNEITEEVKTSAQSMVRQALMARLDAQGRFENPDKSAGHYYEREGIRGENIKGTPLQYMPLSPSQRSQLIYQGGYTGTAYGGNTIQERLNNAREKLQAVQKRLIDATDEERIALEAQEEVIIEDIKILSNAQKKKRIKKDKNNSVTTSDVIDTQVKNEQIKETPSQELIQESSNVQESINKEQEKIDNANDSIKEHTEEMDKAVDSESQKIIISEKLAKQLDKESDALDEVENKKNDSFPFDLSGFPDGSGANSNNPYGRTNDAYDFPDEEDAWNTNDFGYRYNGHTPDLSKMRMPGRNAFLDSNPEEVVQRFMGADANQSFDYDYIEDFNRVKQYTKELQNQVKAAGEVAKYLTKQQVIQERISKLEQENSSENQDQIDLLKTQLELNNRNLSLAKQQYEAATTAKDETKVRSMVENRSLREEFARAAVDAETSAQISMREVISNSSNKAQVTQEVFNENAQLKDTKNKIKEYESAYKKQLQYERDIARLRKNMEGQSGVQLKDSERQVEALQNQLTAISSITSGYDRQNGTLNGIKLSTEAIAQLNQFIDDAQMAQATALTQINTQYNRQQGLLASILGGFKNAFRNITDASLAYAIINKVKMGINEVITATKELDSALVDIQIATGQTRQQTRELLIEYAGLADELGRTTKSVATASNDWLRAGYQGKEAAELTRASMMLSTLGMIDASDATTYLISTLKGWKIQADEVVDVVDKLTAVDIRKIVSLYSNIKLNTHLTAGKSL